MHTLRSHPTHRLVMDADTVEANVGYRLVGKGKLGKQRWRVDCRERVMFHLPDDEEARQVRYENRLMGT